MTKPQANKYETDNPRAMLASIYKKAFIAKMSDSEAKTMSAFHLQHFQAFDDICDALVAQRGQVKSALSKKQRNDLVAEVESLIEEWDEAENQPASRSQQPTNTPLTAALERHYDIGLARDHESSRRHLNGRRRAGG